MADGETKLPGLTSGDRLILVILLAALLGVLSVHYALQAGIGQAKPQLIPAKPLTSHKVNINAAPWWELQALQGIGEKRAKDIVAYREKHGLFKALDSSKPPHVRPALTDVPGIGPKTIEKLLLHLTFVQDGTDDAGN